MQCLGFYSVNLACCHSWSVVKIIFHLRLAINGVTFYVTQFMTYKLQIKNIENL